MSEEEEEHGEAPPPDQAPPQDAPEEPKQPITVSEMADLLAEEAYRRGIDARVFERQGHPLGKSELRAIEVKWACARFLDLIAPHMPEIRKLLKSQGRKKHGSGER
ncbi:hypothetical protein [Brucella intermedia]|uniref:Uncharacterized protein n=1 Tax=Brucella intermedia M86 TaxID=1234597 RepID=M5K504_9HYPH|nr:hypothetical protein [Brucella intermedia]ELT50981.1 hypothetical protein D584_01268 [Brucella intermedia M86]